MGGLQSHVHKGWSQDCIAPEPPLTTTVPHSLKGQLWQRKLTSRDVMGVKRKWDWWGDWCFSCRKQIHCPIEWSVSFIPQCMYTLCTFVPPTYIWIFVTYVISRSLIICSSIIATSCVLSWSAIIQTQWSLPVLLLKFSSHLLVGLSLSSNRLHHSNA